MTRKTFTGLFASLLLGAIACTKENNSTSSSLNTGTANELKQSGDNRSTDRSVVGQWILNYDWYCDGIYGSTLMNINSDGTWSSDQGYTGHWSKGVGIFVMNFDGGYATIYTGDVYPNAIRGLNTVFSYGDGCFSMTPTEGKTFKAQRAPGEPDIAGKK